MSNADWRRSAVTVVLALGALWPAHDAAVVQAQDARPESVKSYLAIVTEYATGDPVQAIASLGRWAPYLTRDVQRSATIDARTMRAAAMLETDSAFDARTPFDAMLGRLENAGNWLLQAEAVARDRDVSSLRRRWHLVVGRRLIWQGFMGVADRILGTACRLYPADIDLLFASAMAKESLAQSYVVDPALPESQQARIRRPRTEALDEAKSRFERVVKAWPAVAEAKVRLARLLVLQGDDKRAAVLLEGARASSTGTPREIGYLASLLLGELRARSGQLPEAIELFDEARKLVPGGQNAYLAHARALQAAGQLDAASAVIKEMLARPFLENDPWRQYPLGFDEAATNLAPLRDEVRHQ